MEYQEQLKLQSYLDGELSEAESREVAARLAQDADGVALLAELRQTRQTLAGFERGVKLPEAREFYWSKIQRQIETVERTPAPVASIPLLARLRRFLMPVAGLAVFALLGLVVTHESGGDSGDTSAETAMGDSGAFTYHDYSAGATLVWLSYPAEDETANSEDPDPLD
ncbi:MAG TPA: hypothetical protein VKY92_15245 [Verrucomicrobiae bacterium]|nr:hypothetical protein [Verrucomicrobiae bacterium]